VPSGVPVRLRASTLSESERDDDRSRPTRADSPYCATGRGGAILLDVNPEAKLSAQQRAWIVEREALWRRATAIAAQHPGMDVVGVYHVLCNLKRSPEERLRRGLGRLRPDRT
jgi:hypothetical protein